MTGRRLTIIGAGGHAKVVIATARTCGWNDLELADDAPKYLGTQVLGVTVAREARAALADPDSLAIIAIGDNAVRSRLAETARCEFASLVHPRAYVEKSVAIGNGTVVFAGVIVQVDAVLGEHTILNTSSSVDHDCVIGRAVHVGPGARLCGAVRVGDRALIGVGAVVIPCIEIGRDVVVGGGAAVVSNLPSATVAVGVPARVLSRV